MVPIEGTLMGANPAVSRGSRVETAELNKEA